jgi:hypothetical protein
MISVGSEVVSVDGQVALGRTKDDLSHTSDMALMEVNLYSEQLTPRQMKDEMSLLSAVYGGDQ